MTDEGENKQTSYFHVSHDTLMRYDYVVGYLLVTCRAEVYCQ